MLEKILRLLYRLMIEIRCLGCNENTVLVDDFLCKVCKNKLETELSFREEKLVVGKKLIPIYSLGIYQGDLLAAKLIRLFKYIHNRELIKLWSMYVYKLWYKIPNEAGDVITYVPSHWRRTNWRGFNQAKELATSLSEFTGLRVWDMFLKIRHTGSQVGHSGKERRARFNNSFKLKNRPPPGTKRLIIVDDVITTGSTIRALIEAWESCVDYDPSLKISVLTLQSRLVF